MRGIKKPNENTGWTQKIILQPTPTKNKKEKPELPTDIKK